MESRGEGPGTMGGSRLGEVHLRGGMRKEKAEGWLVRQRVTVAKKRAGRCNATWNE